MRPTPFYLFEYTLPGATKPKRTTYRMTIENAAKRFPGAVPLQTTKEMRNLPDDPANVHGGLVFAVAPKSGFKPPL